MEMRGAKNFDGSFYRMYRERPISPKSSQPLNLTTLNVPLSKPKGRFSVKFYTFAMLFIIFDIELMFLFPWATVFRKLGAAAFIEMLIFLGIVGIGFLYAWRKGALEWD